jgi:GxxExxY protein
MHLRDAWPIPSIQIRRRGDPRTYDIIGAAMEVHTQLGCGFVELVYRRPFARELAARSVPFEMEKRLPVIYKGEPTGVYFTPDFVCFGDVIVELKALKALGPIEEAQALNYLKLAKFRCALVLNFGTKSLQWQRFVL